MSTIGLKQERRVSPVIFNKLRNTIIVIVLVAITLITMSTVQAQTMNGKVDQGETIFLSDPHSHTGSQCTVGYIDHNKSKVYTAGHCGQSGNIASIVEEEYLDIGVFHSDFKDNAHRNDVGWVKVPSHMLGSNIYTGNDIAIPSRGDKLCSYGSTSKKIHCGIIRGFDGQIILSDKGGIPGDSGGPAWVPGKGFVGTYSVFWENENKHRLGTGFTPIYGYDNKNETPRPLTKNPIFLNYKNFNQFFTK